MHGEQNQNQVSLENIVVLRRKPHRAGCKWMANVDGPPRDAENIASNLATARGGIVLSNPRHRFLFPAP